MSVNKHPFKEVTHDEAAMILENSMAFDMSLRHVGKVPHSSAQAPTQPPSASSDQPNVAATAPAASDANEKNAFLNSMMGRVKPMSSNHLIAKMDSTSVNNATDKGDKGLCFPGNLQASYHHYQARPPLLMPGTGSVPFRAVPPSSLSMASLRDSRQIGFASNG